MLLIMGSRLDGKLDGACLELAGRDDGDQLIAGPLEGEG